MLYNIGPPTPTPVKSRLFKGSTFLSAPEKIGPWLILQMEMAILVPSTLLGPQNEAPIPNTFLPKPEEREDLKRTRLKEILGRHIKPKHWHRLLQTPKLVRLDGTTLRLCEPL